MSSNVATTMSGTQIKTESSNKSFQGTLTKYSFSSKALGGLTTNVNVFLPAGAKDGAAVPVLYYLAGLTCTEDTGAQKGGFLGHAAASNIALVFPDTSPRGAGIEGEDKDWDLGTGAGFYLNATSDKWSKHYRMEEFIVEELPKVLKDAGLPIDFTKASIFGHSMGGHGALTLYLKHQELYKSASAFAPISNPTQCPWGEKAFSNYLSDPSTGSAHDATHLLGKLEKSAPKLRILVDAGTGDQFYKDKQILPENLIEAAKTVGREHEVDVRLRDGYDHSYYFISTFAEDHMKYHAKALLG